MRMAFTGMPYPSLTKQWLGKDLVRLHQARDPGLLTCVRQGVGCCSKAATDIRDRYFHELNVSFADSSPLNPLCTPRRGRPARPCQYHIHRMPVHNFRSSSVKLYCLPAWPAAFRTPIITRNERTDTLSATRQHEPDALIPFSSLTPPSALVRPAPACNYPCTPDNGNRSSYAPSIHRNTPGSISAWQHTRWVVAMGDHSCNGARGNFFAR